MHSFLTDWSLKYFTSLITLHSLFTFLIVLIIKERKIFYLNYLLLEYLKPFTQFTNWTISTTFLSFLKLGILWMNIFICIRFECGMLVRVSHEHHWNINCTLYKYSTLSRFLDLIKDMKAAKLYVTIMSVLSIWLKPGNDMRDIWR